MFNRTRTYAAGALVSVALTLGIVAMKRAEPAGDAARVRSLVGDTLPTIELQTPTGERTTLRDYIGQSAALVYVFNAAECASCSNLPLEFRLMRDKMPHIKPVLIGSGSDVATFKPLFDKMGVASAALVDEAQRVIGAFHFTSEPLVFLADSAGRVLYVDTRSAPQAAQYPMGRLLTELRVLLTRPADSSKR
jgi:peroxiredoxin